MKGIEPSTRSLGSYCSTTELHPPTEGLGLSIQMHGDKGAQPGEPSFLAAPGLRGAFPKTAKPSRERHATLEVALKTAAPVSDVVPLRSKRFAVSALEFSKLPSLHAQNGGVYPEPVEGPLSV